MSELTLQTRVRRALSRTLRPLEAKSRRAVLGLVDRWVLRLHANPDPRRVLLVRLDNIGDFVVWFDAAQAIVNHYREQGCTVHLAANATWAKWASQLKLCDEVIPIDQQRFRHDLRYRHGLLKRLRKAGFGTAVHPALTRVAEMGDAVVKISGATKGIGALDLREKERPSMSLVQDGCYTRLIPVGPQYRSEMRANAEFVRGLIGAEYRAKVADLREHVSPECLDSIDELHAPAPYVVLFPGASGANRKWPAENFAALARRCRAEYGCKVVICGSPSDADQAEIIVKASGPGVVDLAGKTDLQQLATLVAGAKLLVSNETSAVHIAAAVGAPSICVLGGGHYGRFLPYEVDQVDERTLPVLASYEMACFGCNWACKYHPGRDRPAPCVERISVDAVWREVTGILTPAPEFLELCV